MTLQSAPVADGVQVSGEMIHWEEGIGDDTKYHIAHVSLVGLTFVRKLKDHARFQQLVSSASSDPANAIQILRSEPKAEVLNLADIARVSFAEPLNQLYLYDTAGTRTKIPEGKGKPQGKVFEAFKKLPGWTPSEEEADAWSILQTPLFVLCVIGVIGGFFIWFTSICEPNYEASGRRSGMKQLMNTVGYAIGPFWMSVAVGLLALPITLIAISQLIKRPIRQILMFQ